MLHAYSTCIARGATAYAALYAAHLSRADETFIGIDDARATVPQVLEHLENVCMRNKGMYWGPEN